MFSWLLIFIMLGLYTLACVFLIFVILIQSGKGGGLSSLGSASSGLTEALGATGAEKTLNKLTTWAAIGFMVLAMMLTITGKHLLGGSGRTILGNAPATQTAPQEPIGGAPGTQPPPAGAPGMPVGPGPEAGFPAGPAPVGPSAPAPVGPPAQSAPIAPPPGAQAPVNVPPAAPPPANAPAQP